MKDTREPARTSQPPFAMPHGTHTHHSEERIQPILIAVACKDRLASRGHDEHVLLPASPAGVRAIFIAMHPIQRDFAGPEQLVASSDRSKRHRPVLTSFNAK
eukprot:646370-Hanusia_phi.AAC.2